MKKTIYYLLAILMMLVACACSKYSYEPALSNKLTTFMFKHFVDNRITKVVMGGQNGAHIFWSKAALNYYDGSNLIYSQPVKNSIQEHNLPGVDSIIILKNGSKLEVTGTFDKTLAIDFVSEDLSSALTDGFDEISRQRKAKESWANQPK